MKRAVIVVAGGSGKRMGCDMPKQFLPVGGKPILMHTLNNLYSLIYSLQTLHAFHFLEIALFRNTDFVALC